MKDLLDRDQQIRRVAVFILTLAISAGAATAQSSATKSPAEVLKVVEEAINQTSQRHMDFQVNTPWQILHGLLALRENYVLKNGDQMVNALHHMSNGAQYKGKLWFEATQYGGRAHPYNGTPYDFEGHVNQSLAIIAMCNPPLTHQFLVEGGRSVTMADMIKHAQMMVNSKEETTWTLWFLTHYLDQDTQWVNAQGQRWSMESLVRIQTAASPIGAPCGGTHSLFALAYARNSYLQKHGELRGAWLEADQKLQRYIAAAQAMQNRDGSFATQFFKARGFSNEFNERIKSSGHMLEWLMMALPRKRLDEAWVARGVERLAQDLLDNAENEAECGPLYHSLHALILYRQRVAPDLSPPIPAELAANGNARPLASGSVISVRPDNSASPENVEKLPEASPSIVGVPGTDVAMTAKPESGIPAPAESLPGTNESLTPKTASVPDNKTSATVAVPTPKSEVVIESNGLGKTSPAATKVEPQPTRTAELPNKTKSAEPSIKIEPKQPARVIEGRFPKDLPQTSPEWLQALRTPAGPDAGKSAVTGETTEPPTVPMPVPMTPDAAPEAASQEPRPVQEVPALMPILKRPRAEIGEKPEDLMPKVRPIKDETPASPSYEFSDDQFLTPPTTGN